MRLIDKAGNDTCPLLSINDLRRLRMVIDYEEGTVMFNGAPDIWHKLPTTKKGLMMMIPLTEEACERYKMMTPPPPPPTTKRTRKKKEKAFSCAGCDCGQALGLSSGV